MVGRNRFRFRSLSVFLMLQEMTNVTGRIYLSVIEKKERREFLGKNSSSGSSYY
jgi:hypothetical protein